MTENPIFRFILFGILISLSGIIAASEVSIQHKGMTLNAKLELAANKKISDGVILITHAGLAHYGMETYDYIRNLLKERGYSTLSINLSLGINKRTGMYNCNTPHRHKFDDAAGEIDAWVDWLKNKRTKQITLLGHSRGGLQTALYMAEKNNPLVSSVILLAPDTQSTNNAAAYKNRHGVSLAPILKKAQRLVKAGKGGTMLKKTGILYCSNTLVSADTIESYYGLDPRLNTPYFIPKIKKPVLILIGGGDEIVVGHKDKFILLKNGSQVQVKVVDGADHFFRFLYADDAVEYMDTFLRSVKSTNLDTVN